ncbi:unnamed protein product, partial [Musa acuminata subsp. burmannicoides]
NYLTEYGLKPKQTLRFFLWCHLWCMVHLTSKPRPLFIVPRRDKKSDFPDV